MDKTVYKDQGSRLRIFVFTIACALFFLGTWGAYCIWINNFTLACVSLLSGGLPALSIYWFMCLKEKHTLNSNISNLLIIVGFDAKANVNLLKRLATGQYRVVEKDGSSNAYEIKFGSNVFRDFAREPFLSFGGMEKSIYDLHQGLATKDYITLYELYSRTKELNQMPLLANAYASDLLKKTEDALMFLKNKYKIQV